jgi:hypothetical protein
MKKTISLSHRAVIITCWIFSLAAGPCVRATEPDAAVREVPVASPLRTKLLKAFEGANKVVLYSISPEEEDPSKRNFHGHPIVGKAMLRPEEATAAFAEIQHSLHEWNVGGGLCFNPHHGLSWRSGTHRYDLVICYLCGVLDIYEDSVEIGAFNTLEGTPTVLRNISNSHGLPVSSALSKSDRLNAQAQRREAHWLEVMPDSIRPLWDDYMKSSGRRSLEPLQAALAKAVPDEKQRILILYAWYGSGAGPWSGYPGYEDTVADLLRAYPLPDLREAAQASHLSAPELSGAARFFRGSVQTDDRQILATDLDAYFHTTDAWQESMPSSIKPLWIEEIWFISRVDQATVRKMLDALAAEYPDRVQQLLALLAWYGSGGPTLSYRYGYENVVEQLLFEFSSTELVQALQSPSSNERQMDGAARMLANWYFQRERPGDIQAFPPALKSALLAHIRKRGIPEWEKYSAAFQ